MIRRPIGQRSGGGLHMQSVHLSVDLSKLLGLNIGNAGSTNHKSPLVNPSILHEATKRLSAVGSKSPGSLTVNLPNSFCKGPWNTEQRCNGSFSSLHAVLNICGKHRVFRTHLLWNLSTHEPATQVRMGTPRHRL